MKIRLHTAIRPSELLDISDKFFLHWALKSKACVKPRNKLFGALQRQCFLMEMTIEEVKAFREELIAGNTSRLKTIFLAFKDDCVNFLNVKFPSAKQNSEDVFNDALIVLHNNVVAGKVTHFTSVKSYLISVCVNLCKRNNHLKNNFEKKIEEIRLHFSLFSDSSIEEEEEKDFMRATSKEALTSLSEKCQTIITYYYLYQMKMKEIAEKLELSSADVAKTLKSRCFKSLIKKVNELLKSRS